jgi:hypothetical protein
LSLSPWQTFSRKLTNFAIGTTQGWLSVTTLGHLVHSLLFSGLMCVNNQTFQSLCICGWRLNYRWLFSCFLDHYYSLFMVFLAIYLSTRYWKQWMLDSSWHQKGKTRKFFVRHLRHRVEDGFFLCRTNAA